MDFSPSVTRNDCMTSALNATLLTFNGNEMSLQNDMGNGRVETAFLPEGYTPVGTCEFGDIIYIISYNPMINKA
jgi:alkyl hydroperoxide reductase subunit AhpC